MLVEHVSMLCPPVPHPRPGRMGLISLCRTLATNPLEAWTDAHFTEPIVMGGLPFGRVAVVNEPAAIRRVLLDNHANYHKDWLQRRVLSAGLTDGLLTAECEQWRKQRRAIAPLFARRNVMSFAATMLEAAEALVARMTARKDGPVDVAVEITRTTLDVLARTIFSDGLGGDREDIRKGMQRYFEAIGRIEPLDILGIPAFVPRSSRAKARAELRLFEAAIDAVIARRRHRIQDGGSDRAPEDLLTRLIKARDSETGAPLSEREVRANVLTFIAAGHETTANCLTWTLFLLSQYPRWAERVRAEAERELGKEPDGLVDRLVDTRAVLDEANRLYPPIAAISRAAVGPDKLAGQTIKRGTMVVIAPYVLHRHRSLWVAPDRFDPSRFLGKARERIDRFAYLPFGAGPRICVGAAFAMQEAAIILAVAMRHCRFELAPGHKVWPIQKVTLRPKGGMPMRVSLI